jgi:hypothetical protein
LHGFEYRLAMNKKFAQKIKNKTIAPSPLVGEGGDEGARHDHPHLNPPPSRGRIILGDFYPSRLMFPS